MKLTTKKGYDFFEVVSALQKAIRRSLEGDALFFAVELFNSGYDGFLWRRLCIIASEDIGLAEPLLPATLHALRQSYDVQKKEKKENKPERMFLIHAVLILVRAKKSRLVDWYMIKLWREHDGKTPELPDYAFDMHTQKGKRLGRGLDHFYKEGTELTNQDTSLRPLEDSVREEAYHLHKATPSKMLFPDMEYHNNV